MTYESRLHEFQTPQEFAKPQELIGVSLEEIRAQLLMITNQLEGQLTEHALPLLKEARARLENHACRIAVVGQVKSGKSTLINALLKTANLLPTDINPWTAVVTSLHFRKGPRARAAKHAAEFHFFSLDEWRGLAEGRGKIQELTQRLVPEFRPELLRAQVDAMYQRAARRLGPNLQQLLGQCRRFDEITPQLLSDYISAGDDPAGKEDRPIYSDITRSAELFFNTGPFAFPVTLIDTPGTNDPCLVRDEVTRRSLENPDVYVFTMSALQPLLPADMAMLRLLNGLHKDRIVVFVNRIDQLQNPTSTAPKIKASVENKLRVKLPTLQIPVIVGSAWLGQFSHASQIAQLPPAITAGIIRALRDAGVERTEDGDVLNEFERSQLVAILQSLSGLNGLSAELTRLMSVSNSAVLLQQIANSYFELTRYAEISARAGLRSAEVAPNNQNKPTKEPQYPERSELLRSFSQIENNLKELVSANRVYRLQPAQRGR
jgi:hypothetical protein